MVVGWIATRPQGSSSSQDTRDRASSAAKGKGSRAAKEKERHGCAIEKRLTGRVSQDRVQFKQAKRMAPPARAWAYLLKQPVALVHPGLQTGEPRVRRVPACAACTLKSQAKSVFQRKAVLAQ